ncbi:uncharacterized protein PHACADRAFT_116476 [Phanerochaete carnosa HHB-10118-sp]|uniref:Uncharacterized protein n=1 Tax=Phanerochaete carnosa (strain HHB-10118-sp) TaxID=650164 RepID=K5X547_PHACS|nr:uncharacterized protein PHACADRAFT_116476 [Phanerochaete carnosa HHB-10118-sp]EKM57967.1 hypothetical protein PHACADRAFT_116476 [Phanerochaete carnosa HHB-10118-sp]
MNLNHDHFQRDSDQVCDQRTLGLATPTYTPLAPTADLPSVADEEARALLEARIAELESLCNIHDRLAAKQGILSEDVALWEDKISALQTEVKEKDNLLAAQQQDLSVTRLEVLLLQSEVSTLTNALQENSAALVDTRKALEVKEREMAALSTEKTHQEAKLAETGRVLEALEDEYEQKRLELVEDAVGLQKKLALACETEASIQADFRKRLEEMSALEARNLELEASVLSVTEQLTTAQGDIVDLMARLATANSEIAVLVQERDAGVAKYETARDGLEAAQVSMETLEQELALARDSAAQNKTRTTNLTGVIALAEQDTASLREQLDVESGRALILAGEKDAAVAQLTTARKELDDATSQLHALSASSAEKDAAIDSLEGRVSSVQSHVADLASQLEQLEADKSALQLGAEELNGALAAKDAELAETNAALQVQQESASELERQLAVSVAKNVGLTSELSAKAGALELVRTQLEAAQGSLSDLYAQLDQSRLEAEDAGRAASAQITALDTSVQAAREQVTTLQARLESAEQGHEELADRFQQSTTNLATSQAALQLEEERAASLDMQVSAMVVEKETLVRRLAEWARTKAQDDETIGKLKHIVERHETFFKRQVAEISREATILLPASPPREANSL